MLVGLQVRTVPKVPDDFTSDNSSEGVSGVARLEVEVLMSVTILGVRGDIQCSVLLESGALVDR